MTPPPPGAPASHAGRVLLVMLVAFAGTLAVCLALGWWLYDGDRVARAWSFPHPQSESYGGLVRSDGVGYLAWTYALAEGDLCFARYIADTAAIQPQEASGFRLETSPGCFVPQYTIGQGLVWAPWIFGGRAAIAAVRGTPPGTWVSRSSGLGMLIGSAFLAALGVAASIWALRRRFRLSDAVLATGSAFMGTYGLHYATFDAQFSHATSFGLFGVLLALTSLLRDRIRSGRPALMVAIALGADVGLIGLVRLPNLAIVAVFCAIAFAGPFKAKWRRRNHRGTEPLRSLAAIAVAAAIAAAILCAQLVVWRAATGAWLPKTYVGQGFSVTGETPVILARILLDPQWHGFLIWSPIAIVAVAGFVLRRHALTWLGWGSIAAILTMLATSAAWTFPSGAGGLGLRFMIDVAPFVAVGAALALEAARMRTRRWSWIAVAAVIMAVSAWSLLAMIAYWDLRFAITGASLSEMVQSVTSPRLP